VAAAVYVQAGDKVHAGNVLVELDRTMKEAERKSQRPRVIVSLRGAELPSIVAYQAVIGLNLANCTICALIRSRPFSGSSVIYWRFITAGILRASDIVSYIPREG
jgi:hypothetical protein